MKKRNNYTKDFKKRVALEAIQSDKTIAQIATDFEVGSNQVRDWKTLAISAMEDCFATKRGRKAKKNEDEFESKDLYEQIGRLKVENEFLKKKYKQILEL